MNYEYKCIDKKIILSRAEHDFIRSKVATGQTSVYLRDGALMVNMNMVGAITPTEDSIQLTSDERLNLLRLETKKAEEAPGNLLGPGRYGGMKKAVETSDKECAGCKQIHYIPDGKTLCLPCLGKTFAKA